MSEKTDFRAVETVRQIRDRQAELLAGKSDKEVMEFFARAGKAIRKKAKEISKTQPAQGQTV